MTDAPARGAVLGLSFGFHDAAAAIVVDGDVVAAAEQERFTRVKHDRTFPAEAIQACLVVAGLDVDDVSDVVYYEKPLVLLSRYLATRQRQGPSGMHRFVRELPPLLRHNLGLGYRVGRFFQAAGRSSPPPLRFVEHHRSHAAAAFFPSPFDSAAVLTVDGIGEWATASIAQGTGNRLDLLEELRFPDSVGLLYSFMTTWCGFEANDGEYKLMGLAPYGSPRFAEALEELAPIGEDGSTRVDARRLRWYTASALGRSDLHRLLGGPPRQPGEPLDGRFADLAASVQAHTETAMLRMAVRAAELTGEDALCLAGGVALNCVANGRILREGPFSELWVQPAAGDAGSAIGAALAYVHESQRARRPPGRVADAMSGSLLGPVISGTIDEHLAELGVVADHVTDPAQLAQLVAEALADGRVVGWVQGRMEFGPRALGNRSILADPRDPTVHRRLNLLVKGRESFRPFAPAVLAERAADWFDLDAASPYMLIVAPVRADRLVDVDDEPAGIAERAVVARSQIPACTHVDGSARVQTVTAESNPGFHGVLAAFERAAGCPVLVNTSFNLAGEPIVASVADAVRTAAIGGFDLLVVDGRVVDRTALDDAARRSGWSALTAEVPA